jgi:hypothetical protein
MTVLKTISEIIDEAYGGLSAPVVSKPAAKLVLERFAARLQNEWREREQSYYSEAAKAYEALTEIVRAYDAFRTSGAAPAPELYANIIDKINSSRSILGPQFQDPVRRIK